jgi:hypothetical protein
MRLIVRRQQDKVIDSMRRELMARRKAIGGDVFVQLPKKGLAVRQVLEQLDSKVRWQGVFQCSRRACRLCSAAACSWLLHTWISRDMYPPTPTRTLHPRHLQAAGDISIGSNGDSRLSGALYFSGTPHRDLLSEAYCRFSSTNPIHGDIWPSVQIMETEVVKGGGGNFCFRSLIAHTSFGLLFSQFVCVNVTVEIIGCMHSMLTHM